MATAFYISGSGQLLTTWKEIRACRRVAIMSSYELRNASVASSNPLNGLALLQTGEAAASYASFRTSSVVAGEEVRTISYPVSDGLSMPLGVARGTVRSEDGVGEAKGIFAVSALLDGQTAGGPIIDKRGDVIGIAVDVPDVAYPSGVGYGISNVLVAKFLSSAGIEILTRGADGDVGSAQDIAPDVAGYTVPVICFR